MVHKFETTRFSSNSQKWTAVSNWAIRSTFGIRMNGPRLHHFSKRRFAHSLVSPLCPSHVSWLKMQTDGIIICVIKLIFKQFWLMKSSRLDFTILIIHDALIKTQFVSKLKPKIACWWCRIVGQLAMAPFSLPLSLSFCCPPSFSHFFSDCTAHYNLIWPPWGIWIFNKKQKLLPNRK